MVTVIIVTVLGMTNVLSLNADVGAARVIEILGRKHGVVRENAAMRVRRHGSKM
jgi:hypothetical protein